MAVMRHSVLLLIAVLACVGRAPAQGEPPADVIFHNGVIWTGDASRPAAEAVATRGDTIVAVGKEARVMTFRAPTTRVIDLGGRLLLPGFCDNHVHFANAARFHEFNVMATSTQAEFVDRMREAVKGLPKGEWILGGFWGAYDRWTPGSAGGDVRASFTPDMARTGRDCKFEAKNREERRVIGVPA